MRRLLVCLAIFIASLTVYLANGETISSYDSVPNTVLAFNAFEHRTLDLDRFRKSYFDALGGAYAFVEAPNGHVSSVFPVGTAILTLPLYASLYAIQRPPEITSPSFEPQRLRDEKLVASIVAALSAVLLFLCASLIGTAFQATIATVAFALGTETWMIGSQGLWQHGSVSLVLAGLIYALLRAARATPDRERGLWLMVAGILAGFLPVVRPTALLFSVAALAFVLPLFGRARWTFVLAAAVGYAPGLAWNAAVFHSLSGGYEANLALYDFSLPHAAVALTGLLFSPSRGLIVYTPLVLFSALGAWRAARQPDPPARLLMLMAAACVALTVNYALFQIWIAGDCYGPRFFTDAMAIAALLLVFVLPPDFRQQGATALRAVLAMVFAAILAYSVGVQAVGAFSGAAGPLWNAIPFEVGRVQSRVWDVADSQIERNARATFYHYAPVYPTSGAAYAAGFAGHLLGVTKVDGSPISVERGAKIDVAATVRNDGPSRLYGYPTAVYNGEAQVDVRIDDARGVKVGHDVLYIDGSPRSGESATALGSIDIPALPGMYSATFDVVAFGIDSTAQSLSRRSYQMTLIVP